jgi:hypothetical protein
MDDAIDMALREARRERKAGRAGEAEQAYLRAADLARAAADADLLAHALRHLSDLARERGARAEAFDRAAEAVARYRAGDDRLGLANALRLQALAAAEPEKAAACWREARDLYAALGIHAGVTECEVHLAAEPPA